MELLSDGGDGADSWSTEAQAGKIDRVLCRLDL